MVAWAEKLLYLGMVAFVLGILLRLTGYNDTHGFLEPLLSHGLTPDAFLRAGAVCALFAIGIVTIELAKRER